MSSLLSSSKAATETINPNSSTTLLPILIIPGFMSSGMEIIESDINPNWVGKRVWINLASLGLSALYFGTAQKQQPSKATSNQQQGDESSSVEYQQQNNYKSAWLKHMMLSPTDMRTEPNGIKVRPIPNLDGVDYLSPGALTNHVSYVFGPVITALQKEGYNSGSVINLIASTYDWRLPPSELERRDQYFTRTIQSVEGLYQNNNNTPIILLGHSLGCKTAHYFLNFAKRKKGQSWIDKHIHTYLPVGAPHLGAPKALRSTISGDKMSLDAFLNDEEALVLGRSFGSGPWLLPQVLPEGVPASSYVLPHGVLEITFTHSIDTNGLVSQREAINRPNRYQLQVVARGLNDGHDQSRRVIKTPFNPISTDFGPDVVSFSDRISFATDPSAKPDAILHILLQEPGIAVAKKDKIEKRFNLLRCIIMWLLCCCICDLIYKFIKSLTCGLIRGATLAADVLTSTAGGGTTTAFSEGIRIPSAVWKGATVALKVPIYHVDDYGQKGGGFLGFLGLTDQPRTAQVHVQVKWYGNKTTKSKSPICSPICQPSTSSADTKSPYHISIDKRGERYEAFSGYDIIDREGLANTTLKVIKDLYDGDVQLPRSYSSSDPPPVKRIHAIYGINLPTEIGAVYSRQDTCLSENKLQSLYAPDSKATLGSVGASNDYSLKGGILKETSATKQSVSKDRQVSGDGTVPYWSLQHCRTWHGPNHTVTVHELDKAEHREILADPRFHDAIMAYVKR